jgi:hypothetical protein
MLTGWPKCRRLGAGRDCGCGLARPGGGGGAGGFTTSVHVPVLAAKLLTPVSLALNDSVPARNVTLSEATPFCGTGIPSVVAGVA